MIGMSRYDLTELEWRVIEPLLPNKPRVAPQVDDRRVLERFPLRLTRWGIPFGASL